MSKKVKIFFLFILLLPFFSLEAKDDKARLSLGGGIYNFMKHGSDGYNQSSLAYNFELFSGKKHLSILDRLSVFLEQMNLLTMDTLVCRLTYIFLDVNVLF